MTLHIIMRSVLLFVAALVALSTQAALPIPAMLLTAAPRDQRPHSERSRATSSLTFDDNGDFRISIFEDLHFGESEWLRSACTRCRLSASTRLPRVQIQREREARR